jgi:Na+/H+-translocating membrane pyrophosphatase
MPFDVVQVSFANDVFGLYDIALTAVGMFAGTAVSGPGVSILIKVMAVVSLLIAPLLN